jgi:hypothetical protein
MTLASWLVAAVLSIMPSSRSMQPGELVVLDIQSDAVLTAVHARACDVTISGRRPRHRRVPVLDRARRWCARRSIGVAGAPGDIADGDDAATCSGRAIDVSVVITT